MRGSVIGNRFRGGRSIVNQSIHFRNPSTAQHLAVPTLEAQQSEEPEMAFEDPFAKLADHKKF